MKKFYELYRHCQWIEIVGSEIINFNCTCDDFNYRKLKKEEELPLAKTKVIGPCKHLKRLISIYHSEKTIKNECENNRIITKGEISSKKDGGIHL